MERLEWDLILRWFVGRSIDYPVWTTRLSPRTATACWRSIWREVVNGIIKHAEVAPLLSNGQFMVDGS